MFTPGSPSLPAPLPLPETPAPEPFSEPGLGFEPPDPAPSDPAPFWSAPSPPSESPPEPSPSWKSRGVPRAPPSSPPLPPEPPPLPPPLPPPSRDGEFSMVLSEQPRRRFRYRRYFCRWLATFSRVKPSTFMSCMMVLGTAFFTPRCVTASTKRLCSAGVHTKRGRFSACASSSPMPPYGPMPRGLPITGGAPRGAAVAPAGDDTPGAPFDAMACAPSPSRARLNASNERLRSTPYWYAIICSYETAAWSMADAPWGEPPSAPRRGACGARGASPPGVAAARGDAPLGAP